MWLTHKVGLSASEITINAGIIREERLTSDLSSDAPFWCPYAHCLVPGEIYGNGPAPMQPAPG
jgi:hypothetical protein